MHAARPALYPLALHDALPIFSESVKVPPATLLELISDPFFADKEPRLQFDESNSAWQIGFRHTHRMEVGGQLAKMTMRSEEHTSELQSPCKLVCRLLLETKNQ